MEVLLLGSLGRAALGTGDLLGGKDEASFGAADQAGAAKGLLYLYVQLFFVCRGYFKLLGWLGTEPTLAPSSLFARGDFLLSLFLCCINASHFTGLEHVCTAEVS